MTRSVTIDLDNPDDIACLWNEYARIRAIRDVDPELLAILEDLLPKIESNVAAEIREALRSVHPAVVLAEFQDVFFEAKFSTPMSPVPEKNKSHYVDDPTITKESLLECDRRRYYDDPSRLGELVQEIALHNPNMEQVVRAAVAHAERCEIPEAVYTPVIVQTVRSLQGMHHVR